MWNWLSLKPCLKKRPLNFFSILFLNLQLKKYGHTHLFQGQEQKIYLREIKCPGGARHFGSYKPCKLRGTQHKGRTSAVNSPVKLAGLDIIEYDFMFTPVCIHGGGAKCPNHFLPVQGPSSSYYNSKGLAVLVPGFKSFLSYKKYR